MGAVFRLLAGVGIIAALVGAGWGGFIAFSAGDIMTAAVWLGAGVGAICFFGLCIAVAEIGSDVLEIRETLKKATHDAERARRER